MDNKVLWIGGAAVLVLLLVLSRSNASGGAQVIPAPDTSAETAARFQFAASGLDSLSKLADDTIVARTVADAQVQVEASKNAALTAAANAYADAQKYTASKQEQAQTNSSFWSAFGNAISGVGNVLAAVL